MRPLLPLRGCLSAKAIVCPLDKLEDMVRMNKKLLGCEQP